MPNFIGDGKKTARSINFANVNTKEEQNDNLPTELMPLDKRNILSMYKIHMRYYFRKKVDTVSDSTALLSLDGKTVVTDIS